MPSLEKGSALHLVTLLARRSGGEVPARPLDLPGPDLIIETGTAEGGSALLLASVCDLLDRGEVVTITLLRGVCASRNCHNHRRVPPSPTSNVFLCSFGYPGARGGSRRPWGARPVRAIAITDDRDLVCNCS